MALPAYIVRTKVSAAFMPIISLIGDTSNLDATLNRFIYELI